MKNVVIVGAGASGVVSAIFSARGGNKVTILEKENIPLKKILVTGNGKCNYHNENNELFHFHSSEKEEIKKIINEKNLKDISLFFDSIGLVPKIKNGYYYPYSSLAATVREALLKECEVLGVDIKTNFNVTKIEKKEKYFVNGIGADVVIISSGGLSFIKSDYNGYDLISKHSIVKPFPSLVKINGNETYFKKWEKIRCEVILSLYDNSKLLRKEQGELQLTSTGISGICAFNLSSLVGSMFRENKKPFIEINFIPFLKEELISYLEKRSEILKGRNMLELLEGILHYKLVKVILNLSKIKENAFFKDLSLDEKKKLEFYLKKFPFYPSNLGDFNSSQVTNGGVKLSEVDENMKSLKYEDLYLTGEILDLNGDCGGYNLTGFFITGMLAGRDIK